MDSQAVLDAAHDPVTGYLRTTVVTGPASSQRGNHDANAVWATVFNVATGSIKVVIV